MSELIFVGGIDGKRKWLDDGKTLSRNYKQGNRVYSVEGVATALSAQALGGTGGYTSLYLINENQPKGRDDLTKILNYYDADEQADITQTEAEEWATEFAIRAKEGNLDPIPKYMGKKFELYDFKYVSLFSGIGGFEQALNKFGGTCVLSSEIDKFANQAYEVLYGEPTAGDITQIYAKDVPDHDLLVGGFPC